MDWNSALVCRDQGRNQGNASSVEEIVHGIKEYKGSQALQLEGNTIGVEAAQAIAKALETKNELTVCSLSPYCGC